MKNIYLFSKSEVDGNGAMRDELGGKGANLAEMLKIGISVPCGFTIPTKHCIEYVKNRTISNELRSDILDYLKRIEKISGRKFGDEDQMPLLLSIRSGAKFSMPGMMDTILNLGINSKTVKSLAKHTNENFAYDCYRRFLQMYGEIVLGIDAYEFDSELEEIKLSKNLRSDSEISLEDKHECIERFLDIIEQHTGEKFSDNSIDHLFQAVEAVFKSWNNPRAIKYREYNNIPHNIGTAVNIQSMVFGNLNDNSGTGVVFSRNPSNGKKEIFGEYMVNAQGEDVVAGTRTPLPINDENNQMSMINKMPEVYKELIRNINILEQHNKDMQDIEFTIENGHLWILQTRNGKRTPNATIKIAHDLAIEGLISKQEAIKRVDPYVINDVLHPSVDYSCILSSHDAQGLPASPGAACGQAVFCVEDVNAMKEMGIPTILIREETSPDDVMAMYTTEGILTTRGGMTSHAAVVARGIGKPCIVGCESLKIQHGNNEFCYAGEKKINKGDYITIDGGNGKVFLKKCETKVEELSNECQEIIQWSEEMSSIKVMANAETKKDVEQAMKFRASGIGLARTEHMLFENTRLTNFRKCMLLDKNSNAFNKSLSELQKLHTQDFVDLISLTKELPLNIRLLDPPLHEFLHCNENDITDLAKQLNMSFSDVKKKIEDLSESNPMIGHRGVRLSITHKEICDMQINAIFDACEIFLKDFDIKPNIGIMIPLVSFENEMLEMIKAIETIKNTRIELMKKINLKIGVMIETPRACLIAEELSKHVDYFSFGTNDLTQMLLGLSRDDSGKFLNYYQEKGILEKDPFVEVDDKVVEMIKLSLEKVNILSGVCGEHGGNPESIYKFKNTKINYVSCSPYRILLAKLALAR